MGRRDNSSGLSCVESVATSKGIHWPLATSRPKPIRLGFGCSGILLENWADVNWSEDSGLVAQIQKS